MISNSELRRLRPVIASVAFKVTNGKLDASAIDDVVQNVCIKLCQDGYDAKRGMKFRTYVGMVTKCAAIDYIRSWRRPAFQSAPDVLDDIASGNDDALALYIRQEELAKMRQIVEHLSPEQQELLAALQEDDFSIQAYADKHGFAPSYVYVLKFRLSKRLRALLKD